MTLLLSAFAVSTASYADLSSEERKSIESAIDAVKPALVRIHVADVEYDQGREIKSESVGSGAIISKDGYIVTNHHVAGWAKRLVCTMSDKEEIEADLIGTDPLTDIAVIKLRQTSTRSKFPVAKWGDSTELRVGDRIFAMGSPLALSQSVTMGIVSNTEMIMPDFFGSMTLDGEDVGSMVRWIGHDATIQPGNSGGPLVNGKGEIVGINEIGLGSMAGAIPSAIARPVAEEIIKSGKINRSWLGINIQPLLKGSNQKTGVLVGGVVDGSPAALAGIRPGDIIVRLAGKDVRVLFAEEIPLFNQMIAALPVDKEAGITVLRDGKELPLKVTTKCRPESYLRPRELKQWGMCVSNITFAKARECKRANQDGALVWSVRPGGPCGEAKPSVEEDDIIVDVAGKPVKNIQDLADITAEITKDKTEPTPVLITFDRDGERLVTVVKVGIKSIEDPGKEVRKAYLPIGMQVITKDISEALGIGERTGVRVTQVYPNSSASKAGIKIGDLIVALDGEEIPASQPEDTEVLPAMIRQYKVGTNADLTVIRGKEEMKVTVLLEEAPPLPREMKKYRDDNFEFTVRDITQKDRIRQNLEKDVIGVYVDEISQGGWAALGRLSVGDIICTVEGNQVNSVDDLQKQMELIAERKDKNVVLRVRRGINELFVELETDWTNGK
ncbi:MAG: PDZ domain-containing protein [Armatimonadota bacterium]